jgi:hypothetical protein
MARNLHLFNAQPCFDIPCFCNSSFLRYPCIKIERWKVCKPNEINYRSAGARQITDMIKIMLSNKQTNLVSKKIIALHPATTRFVISRKFSAFLVAVNDRDVIIEPHYDEERRFATRTVALALQNLSRIMLQVRRYPDACDFLLEFYACKGWTIEEADIEPFRPES